MAHETVFRNGIILSGSGIQTTGSIIATGSIKATQGFYGDGSGLTGVISSSYTLSSSYVEYSNVANKPTLISGSEQIASEISGAFTEASSGFESRITTAEGSVSSLNNASSSYVLNNAGDTATQNIQGTLKLTGDIVAENYIVSSSVTYMTMSFSSGSTMFGNSLDDTHEFTGSVTITGSLASDFLSGDGSGLTGVISSSYALSSSYVDYTNIDNKPTLISGSEQIASEISGAFTEASGGFSSRITTAEGSISSLNNASSSYVLNSQTSSMSVLSSSYAETASYAPNYYTITQIDDLVKKVSVVGSGVTVIDTVSTASYDGVIWKYLVSSASVNLRVGQVFSAWDNAGNREYTEIASTDLGNTTDADLIVNLNGSNAEFTINAVGDWTVKSERFPL